jgi:hypothetical protein
MLILQIASVFLVAIAMSLSLAHALELPGKLRLTKEEYMIVQPIYYPGFTIGGGVGEGLGLVATLTLLLLTPSGDKVFWWIFTAFIALTTMHAAYWIVTHPVNSFWLKDKNLEGMSAGFFSFDPIKWSASSKDASDNWRRFRDRWEYSHVLRATLSAISLVALIVAVAIK